MKTRAAPGIMTAGGNPPNKKPQLHLIASDERHKPHLRGHAKSWVWCETCVVKVEGENAEEVRQLFAAHRRKVGMVA